jgi:hypothetical protein
MMKRSLNMEYISEEMRILLPPLRFSGNRKRWNWHIRQNRGGLCWNLYFRDPTDPGQETREEDRRF